MRLRPSWIWLVSLLFVALATLYSVTTPIFEAPDELWHYQYIAHLARGGGLPVQTTEALANVAQQEGSQPPLYYALGALMVFATRTLGAADADLPYQLNPVVVGQAEPEEKAMVLHTQPESFPYRGTALVVHLVRLLSVLLGLGTVLATYRVALEVIPERPSLAAAAAAFNAFLPMFGFLSGVINNDSLAVTLSSLTLWQALRTARLGLTPGRALLLGGLAGLAALTKVSGLALLPLALLGLAVAAWQPRSFALLVRTGALLTAAFILVCGWWYARNFWLYGDPLGLGRMLDVAGRRGAGLGMSTLGLSDFDALRFSFWGIFGWANVLADSWFYLIFDALTIVLLVGAAAYLFRHLSKRASANGAILLLLAWLFVFLLAVVQWAQTAEAGAQGRLFFPALSALSVLGVLCLAELSGRWAWATVGTMAAGMGALSAAVPFLFILPAYQDQTQPIVVESAGAVGQPADLDFGGQLRLVGYEVSTRKPKPGETWRLVVYWRVQRAFTDDLRVYLLVQDRTGQRATFRGRGYYRPVDWREGQLLRAQHLVTVPSDLQPLLLGVHLGLYDPMTGRRLATRDGQGRSLGDSALLTHLRVMSRSSEPPMSATAKKTVFGDQVALMNWGVNLESARPGGVVSGILYWEALRPPERDYTVFVQLLGPAELAAQYDSAPQGGEYPTSFWEAKEVVSDHFRLSLPPNLPAGRYRLIVGLYDLATMQRLPVDQADYAVLTEVSISP